MVRASLEPAAVGLRLLTLTVEGTCAADSRTGAVLEVVVSRLPPDCEALMLTATTSGRPGTLKEGVVSVRQVTDTTAPDWVAHCVGAELSVIVN